MLLENYELAMQDLMVSGEIALVDFQYSNSLHTLGLRRLILALALLLMIH